jgi:peptide/nickel transport system substrate-binding protein
LKTRVTATLAVAAAALVAVVFVAGSAAAPSRSSAVIPLLRIAGPPAGGSLDGAKDQNDRSITEIALESLMSLDPRTGKIIPWLATSVTQPGRDIYVYHLRHGVKFWDGNELTSADVANSLNYERFPGSQLGFSFYAVRNVVAKDKYTVVVTLKHPDPNWKFQAAENSTPIFEKKFADAHKGTMGNPGVLMMGTGPWEFQKFDPTTAIDYTANPHWWGGKVNIQHVTYNFFAEENSEALAMRAGQIDLTDALGDPRAFAATSGVKPLSSPGLNEVSISMNVKVPPFNDIHARRAVAYAVNRAEYIKALGWSGTEITTFVLPSELNTIASKAQVDALIKSLPQYPYSIAKAKAELAKSAYPNGFSVTLAAAPYANLGTMCQVLAAQLKKVGINVTVQPMDFGSWFAAVADPNKRPFTIWSAGAFGPDPSGFDSLLGSKNAKQGEINTANYTPASMDTLLQQEETFTNPAKRLVVFKKLLTQLALDLPYIQLYQADNGEAISNKFTWPNYGTYSLYVSGFPLGIRAK